MAIWTQKARKVSQSCLAFGERRSRGSQVALNPFCERVRVAEYAPGAPIYLQKYCQDEFVLHCDTIDSPCTYTGRGESDFGEYTIVGECINGELDSAEFIFRKLV